MSYPSKPWTHNQRHEVFPDKFFRYDSDSGVWARVSSVVSDNQLDSELANVKSERDSDLLMYLTRAEHDSDLNNLILDCGTF